GGYTKYTYEAFTHGETFWADAALNIYSDFREVTSKRVCAKASCTASEEDVTAYSPGVGGGLNNDTMDVRHFIGDQANGISELTPYTFSHEIVDDTVSKYFFPREKSRLIYSASGPLLRLVTTDNKRVEAPSPYQAYLPIRVTTTLNDVSPPLVSKVETSY